MDTSKGNVNHSPMLFTITEPLERLPAFAEIQMLALQHDVKIHGNELAGDFCHPNSGQPKVAGHYTIGPNGEIQGDFQGHIVGRVTGHFALGSGKIEVTIAEKPFLLPEAVLKSALTAALKEFSAKFKTPAG